MWTAAIVVRHELFDDSVQVTLVERSKSHRLKAVGWRLAIFES